MSDKILLKNEFIGLSVTILECTDPTWKGKTGQIIDETKNTFLIEIEKKKKIIEKKNDKFEFIKNGEKKSINGEKIVFRPEDRIKKIR